MNHEAKVTITMSAAEWNTVSAILGYVGTPCDFTICFNKKIRIV